MSIKKVAVIGLGYVGLPTLVAIAKTKKYDVVGFDIDQKKIDLISNGKSPIEDEIVEQYLKKNELDVTTDEKDLKKRDVYIVCVPTPVYDDYTPDYSYVVSAIKLAGQYLTKGSHLVLESTVNPGTCEEVVVPNVEKVTKLKAGSDFNVAHCPERINPGDPKYNIYNINRNIGSINEAMNEKIADFYQSFITKAQVNPVSTIKIAEATKIVENAFRDINIAYVNELAQSFDAMGINLKETLDAAANKPFGFMPHYPGAGVGGHCIAVDPYYLINRAAKAGFDHKFLKLAREINNSMPDYTVEKLAFSLNEIEKSVKGSKVLLLGLSYKPDIGDIRESPAYEIKHILESIGADLRVYDPFVSGEFKTLKSALKGVEAVVVATAHTEFIKKLPKMLKSSKVKVVVDGRNCLPKKEVEALDINYTGIGS